MARIVTEAHDIAVVVPNWNGRRWLGDCLASVARQSVPAAETIVVDNGSDDGSLELLRDEYPWVRTVALDTNTGFAHAANVGVEAAAAPLVALVNNDVVLEPVWLERMRAALARDPQAASAASKMVDLRDPGEIYDAGDFLRRDGACEQRGRFERDGGTFDAPGEVFCACAGAAVYRRDAFVESGGFDTRYFAYLEDVDLGLRLRRAGWRCVYEPAVAKHAGEGSSAQLRRPVPAWVERNTLLLVARHFPLSWAPFVAYRQAGWLWHAILDGGLSAHLRGALAALPLLPAMLRERSADRRRLKLPTKAVVDRRPIRGQRGGRRR